MPQSFDSVLVHLVFSTKHREPCLATPVRAPLWAYLATLAAQTGCLCHRVGGTADHVHLAVKLARTVSVAALVEELKTESSKWLKRQSPELSQFAWQRGYGVFSVGPAGLAQLVAYIDTQEEHHRDHDWPAEYRHLLERHDLVYDERYMWD